MWLSMIPPFLFCHAYTLQIGALDSTCDFREVTGGSEAVRLFGSAVLPVDHSTAASQERSETQRTKLHDELFAELSRRIDVFVQQRGLGRTRSVAVRVSFCSWASGCCSGRSNRNWYYLMKLASMNGRGCNSTLSELWRGATFPCSPVCTVCTAESLWVVRCCNVTDGDAWRVTPWAHAVQKELPCKRNYRVAVHCNKTKPWCMYLPTCHGWVWRFKKGTSPMLTWWLNLVLAYTVWS